MRTIEVVIKVKSLNLNELEDFFKRIEEIGRTNPYVKLYIEICC